MGSRRRPSVGPWVAGGPEPLRASPGRWSRVVRNRCEHRLAAGRAWPGPAARIAWPLVARGPEPLRESPVRHSNRFPVEPRTCSKSAARPCTTPSASNRDSLKNGRPQLRTGLPDVASTIQLPIEQFSAHGSAYSAVRGAMRVEGWRCAPPGFANPCSAEAQSAGRPRDSWSGVGAACPGPSEAGQPIPCRVRIASMGILPGGVRRNCCGGLTLVSASAHSDSHGCVRCFPGIYRRYIGA